MSGGLCCWWDDVLGLPASRPTSEVLLPQAFAHSIVGLTQRCLSKSQEQMTSQPPLLFNHPRGFGPSCVSPFHRASMLLVPGEGWPSPRKAAVACARTVHGGPTFSTYRWKQTLGLGWGRGTQPEAGRRVSAVWNHIPTEMAPLREVLGWLLPDG